MSSTFKRGARLSAIGAAAALAASGLMIAPAVADESAAPTASLDEIAAQAKGIEGVVSILQGGDGVITISTASEEGEGGFAAASSAALNDLDAKYANVEINTDGEEIVAKAANEVVGGAGYMFSTPDGGAVCSVGFSGWSPNGDPAVITAGHCADGSLPETELTNPSGDNAIAGEPAPGEPATISGSYAALGTFGFYQYGGPGDSTGAENDETSTDVAIIENINSELTLKPEVTDWTTGGQDDLAASTIKVQSVGTAAIGDEIQRSGRTTGFETGVVDSVGWASVSGHWVYGYAALQTGDEPLVLGGDSGGAVMSGNKAVGIVSGGSYEGDLLWYADLEAALAVTGGYTVALDIAEPEITKATAQVNTQFEGQAPAGSEITITGDIEATVPADDSGYFSFPAPKNVGSFDIAVTAKQGFNVSETVNATVKTNEVPAPDAPAITSPENELTTTEVVTSITGTGQPGAEVSLKGDAEGTTTVAEDGTWSVDVELGFGAWTVGATQSNAGGESEARWVSFKVVPGAPTIVTPEDGGSYEEGSLPAVTGESPINGATVKITISGDNVDDLAAGVSFRATGSQSIEVEVVGGSWMAELNPELLVPGEYTVTAAQSVNGVSSEAASAAFEVVAAGDGGGEEPGDPGDEGNGDDDGLAPTGAESATTVLPLAGGAAVILLAGATLLVVRRVTRA